MKWFLYVVVSMVFFENLSAQEVTEKVEVVVGRTAELPCNVSAENDSDKLTILAWYRNHSSTAFYSSRDLRSNESTVTSPSNRYRLVNSEGEEQDLLQIHSVRPSDAGLYTCIADFASSPTLKTYVELIVIEPPQKVWVLHENGTRVASSTGGVNISRNIGPYYVGDTIHLVCVAFGGKPKASLSWWTTKRLLKDTWRTLSEQRVRSDLMYGPLEREDHGRVLTCFAKNNDHTTPLYIDVIVDMFLPPALVALRDPQERAFMGGRVREGDPLPLQCRVLGARPTPPIIWRLGDAQLFNVEQNITKEPSQRLVVSEIQLTLDRRHDESRVTCCAPAYLRNQEQFVCAQALPLTVLYPPVLQITVDNELKDSTLSMVKGSTITLNCSYDGNPSVYRLVWFHEENLVTDDTALEPKLVLKNVTENDAGEYVCSGTNEEGSTYSEPIIINITYPAFCKESTVAQYGIREYESVNITCDVNANPQPMKYRWVLVKDAVNASTLRNQPQTTVETDEPLLTYQRPNDTAFSTVFCWGLNDVPSNGLAHTPCVALVTDETAPRPPTNCFAVKNYMKDITVSCDKGHDGGLPQSFLYIVKALDTNKTYTSITSLEPKFMVQEPETEYKFVIIAFNEKGNSTWVEIVKDDIIDESGPEVQISAVSDITTLTLALCGGVALVALAACGLVLCAHDRTDRYDRSELPRARSDPPLCAYNTEESNCETYHDSDDGSECNIRRTESFRRAMAKYPSKNFDVRRTSSFHSARYMNDMAEQEAVSKCNDGLRHSASCRVHSMQNISRKRDMDVLCDHLVMHLPPDVNYTAPRPLNTFYTMPRKMRQKVAKELSDEASEVTQTSDGFSLPPPPDEFGTYRAGTRIRDIPTKTIPSYTPIVRKSTGKETPKQYNPSMNTVGLPTISGQTSAYSYPDDHSSQTHQVNTNPFDEDSS